jgi:hypothetical protein
MSLYVSISHHDDTIDVDTIEEVEVVSDEDDRLACCSPCVDLLAKYVDRVDIETRVDLIEDDDRWFQECYLEELDATLLTTRESDEEITVEDRWIESETREHLLDHTTKYERRWRLGICCMLPDKVSIVDRTEILRYPYTWDLWDIL